MAKKENTTIDNMNEIYKKTISWMLRGQKHNCVVRVESEKKLKEFQEYFKEQIAENKSILSKDDFFERIEWLIE